VQDRVDGGPFDRGPGQIDVLDVLVGELDDEESPVRLAAQQSFLDEALHRLAQRAAADSEPAGQVRLAELRPGRDRAVDDGVAQLAGDHARGGLAGDLREVLLLRLRPHHQLLLTDSETPARNSEPSSSCRAGCPASRRPSQTVTWFAVSTGLPAVDSSRSSQAIECSAVSGIKTASAR